MTLNDFCALAITYVYAHSSLDVMVFDIVLILLLLWLGQHEVLASGPIEDLIAHREHRYLSILATRIDL